MRKRIRLGGDEKSGVKETLGDILKLFKKSEGEPRGRNNRNGVRFIFYNFVGLWKIQKNKNRGQVSTFNKRDDGMMV